MPLRKLTVKGYRSIQRACLRLENVNVIVGPNGCGKSNLYRSLYLLYAAAEGRLAKAFGEEGGMPSALWAGEPIKSQPKRIDLQIDFDDWRYALSCGLRGVGASAFNLDPLIREERLDSLQTSHPVNFCERRNSSLQLRDETGRRVTFPAALAESESLLSELREPQRYPEVASLRNAVLSWRFYHHFRTDADSPLRRPQIGVQTPVLSHDGNDVAAALQTILECGDFRALHTAIEAAFPGNRLEISGSSAGMKVGLVSNEFKRGFEASELSDGTLKYLCLLAALLSPRPPSLIAVNEPDANLHPQLFEPLADLCARAAESSQLWITTHSTKLATLLRDRANAQLIPLQKVAGRTVIGNDDFVEALEDEDDVPNAVEPG